MSGRRLADVLAYSNYDRFVSVVRTMSEQWIASLSAIKMTCEIADRLIVRRYPSSKLATIVNVLNSLREDSAILNDIPVTLRNLLWLRHLAASNLDAEYLQRDRWKPFDERAWDILFEQVVDVLTPALDVWLLVSGHVLTVADTLPQDHPLRIQLVNYLEDGDSHARKLEDLLNPIFVKAQRFWGDG